MQVCSRVYRSPSEGNLSAQDYGVVVDTEAFMLSANSLSILPSYASRCKTFLTASQTASHPSAVKVISRV